MVVMVDFISVLLGALKCPVKKKVNSKVRPFIFIGINSKVPNSVRSINVNNWYINRSDICYFFVMNKFYFYFFENIGVKFF